MTVAPAPSDAGPTGRTVLLVVHTGREGAVETAREAMRLLAGSGVAVRAARTEAEVIGLPVGCWVEDADAPGRGLRAHHGDRRRRHHPAQRRAVPRGRALPRQRPADPRGEPRPRRVPRRGRAGAAQHRRGQRRRPQLHRRGTDDPRRPRGPRRCRARAYLGAQRGVGGEGVAPARAGLRRGGGRPPAVALRRGRGW